MAVSDQPTREQALNLGQLMIGERIDPETAATMRVLWPDALEQYGRFVHAELVAGLAALDGGAA